MSPRNTKIVLPIVVFAVLVGAAVLLASLKQPPEKQEEEVKQLLVETINAEMADMFYQVESQGNVQPKIISQLVSEVSGKIIEVSPKFVNGGFFKKGDILARVESADYETNVKLAEANLARALATLEEEKARAKVAEEEWASFMEGKAPDLYIRKPQVARELANTQYARADLERAKRDLKRTYVKAQFNGLIKSKSVDLGQFVSRGTSLGTLFGTDVAEVRLPLSKQDLAYLDLKKLKSDEDVSVDLGAKIGGEQIKWRARVARTEGVIDEKSRVLYLVAELQDPYGLTNDNTEMTFGLFVSAKVQGRYVKNAVTLPIETVKSNQTVLVVSKENTLEIRKVNIGKRDSDFAYILDGIEHGESIATTSIPNPIQGMKVKIISPDKPAANEPAVVGTGN